MQNTSDTARAIGKERHPGRQGSSSYAQSRPLKGGDILTFANVIEDGAQLEGANWSGLPSAPNPG